jgi:riboflavin biosynthesis pyrimidine reductase
MGDHEQSRPAGLHPGVRGDLAVGKQDRLLANVASPSTSTTRIEREFDDEEVRGLKEGAASDLLGGGPNLAAHAFEAGLVDECHLFVAPRIVGGGKGFLPDRLRQKLELTDERRFGNGMVCLRYRVVT